MHCLHTYLLYLTAVFYAILACVTFARKRTTITTFFGIMLILSGIWAATYTAELDAQDLVTKIRWMKLRLTFTPYLGAVWLAFALAITGMLTTFKRWLWLLVLFVPYITTTLALTGWHPEWFRFDFSTENIYGLQVLTYSSGLWDTIHELTFHATSLLGFFILLSAWHSSTPLLRKQIVILSIAYIFPTLGNIVYTYDLLPSIGINPAPFILLPSTILLAYVVSRYRVLDLVPIARSMILDHINDGLIVLDTSGLIVDINTVAESWIGVKGMEVLGSSPDQLPSPWSVDLQEPEGSEATHTVKIDNKQHWFKSKRIPVLDATSQTKGTLILIRDSTVENLHEIVLQQHRKRELELKQTQIQKLLIRDIHDGLGGIAANIAIMATLARKEQEIQKKDEWLDKLQFLAGEANVEIRELMNSLECNTMGWADVIDAIRRVSNVMFDDRITDLKVHMEGMPPDEEPGILAGLSIVRMAKECMNNIVKHASAERVDIELSFTTHSFHLTISDNGCGFDPETVRRGRGLGNLNKRTKELDGTLKIDTDQGTQLEISIPLPVRNMAENTEQPEEAAR